MSPEGFNFRMAKWMPFQDQQECRRVAAIKREDIARHPNPDFKITVLDDGEFPFRLVADIFRRIKKAGDEGKRLVLILPQPETLYRRVAYLLNQCKVNCSHLYTFNMDEYADEEGNIAPETWPNSFLYNMKKNFYAKLEPRLRPPEEQVQGPTNGNFKDYGKMIEDLGGADVCYGGIGWSGHIAYIEPGSEAYAAESLEEWKKLGPRIVELTPFSILQNCLGPWFGQSGDWSSVPPQGATIGPAQIVGARLRSSWNGFRVGQSTVSWQRFTVRLAAHGPVTPLVPASIIQTCPTELYLSETLAADITPLSVEEFSRWD
jgi:6-phosphogluconolactonase/glucosamine-6-phosphate isomerase/deaminase